MRSLSPVSLLMLSTLVAWGSAQYSGGYSPWNRQGYGGQYRPSGYNGYNHSPYNQFGGGFNSPNYSGYGSSSYNPYNNGYPPRGQSSYGNDYRPLGSNYNSYNGASSGTSYNYNSPTRRPTVQYPNSQTGESYQQGNTLIIKDYSGTYKGQQSNSKPVIIQEPVLIEESTRPTGPNPITSSPGQGTGYDYSTTPQRPPQESAPKVSIPEPDSTDEPVETTTQVAVSKPEQEQGTHLRPLPVEEETEPVKAPTVVPRIPTVRPEVVPERATTEAHEEEQDNPTFPTANLEINPVAEDHAVDGENYVFEDDPHPFHGHHNIGGFIEPYNTYPRPVNQHSPQPDTHHQYHHVYQDQGTPDTAFVGIDLHKEPEDHTQCQEGSVCVIWTKCQKRNGIFRGMCGSHGTFFVCCQMTHVVEQTTRPPTTKKPDVFIPTFTRPPKPHASYNPVTESTERPPFTIATPKPYHEYQDVPVYHPTTTTATTEGPTFTIGPVIPDFGNHHAGHTHDHLLTTPPPRPTDPLLPVDNNDNHDSYNHQETVTTPEQPITGIVHPIGSISGHDFIATLVPASDNQQESNPNSGSDFLSNNPSTQPNHDTNEPQQENHDNDSQESSESSHGSEDLLFNHEVLPIAPDHPGSHGGQGSHAHDSGISHDGDLIVDIGPFDEPTEPLPTPQFPFPIGPAPTVKPSPGQEFVPSPPVKPDPVLTINNLENVPSAPIPVKPQNVVDFPVPDKPVTSSTTTTTTSTTTTARPRPSLVDELGYLPPTKDHYSKFTSTSSKGQSYHQSFNFENTRKQNKDFDAFTMKTSSSVTKVEKGSTKVPANEPHFELIKTLPPGTSFSKPTSTKTTTIKSSSSSSKFPSSNIGLSSTRLSVRPIGFVGVSSGSISTQTPGFTPGSSGLSSNKKFFFGSGFGSTYQKNQFRFGISTHANTCAAAMICVEKQFCGLYGELSVTPLSIPDATRFYSGVPLTRCRLARPSSPHHRPSYEAPMVCCRDPNYIDPWP